MGSVKAVGDFDRQRQEAVRLEGSPGNEVLKTLTFKKLHGYEGSAIRHANLINSADVGVIQCGSSLRFPLKARQSVRIMRRLVRQKLQRDKATEGQVFGLVDNPHPATAQLLDNAVMRDRLADHWRESYVGLAGKSMKPGMLAGFKSITGDKSPLHKRTERGLALRDFVTSLSFFFRDSINSPRRSIDGHAARETSTYRLRSAAVTFIEGDHHDDLGTPSRID